MNKGLLLIAAQPAIVETFTKMLAPEYTVYCSHTEAEGLEILEAHHSDIAAVLIELALARESGFEFSEHLKDNSSFSLIPMIAISDALPTRVDMDCIEHGFFDLITAIAPQTLVYKRISNAIRAKDSMTLQEVEKMLKVLPACIFLKDTEGKYVFSTQYWHHLNTANDPNWTIRGKTDLEIRKDKDNARKAMEADRRIIETGQGTDYIIEENNDGIQEFLQLIKRPVYNDEGQVDGIIALINNVTEYQLMKMELEKRAKTDTLTGLLNKSATQDLIRMMVANYQKAGDHCALLMIDIDDFKDINDTFGHAEGDRVLAEFGHILNRHTRGTDVAGRTGGDEFMVFLRGFDATDTACNFADRIEEQVRQAFANDPVSGYVSVSIGIALFPEHGIRFEALYRAADAALYHVKKHGKSAHRVYDPSMDGNDIAGV